MKIRSRGYQTDFMFARFDGEVIDRGNYIVAFTPENPGFWWGNFVLFPEPPRSGQHEEWKAIFANELGSKPGIGHINLAWDTIDGELGDVQDFLR